MAQSEHHPHATERSSALHPEARTLWQPCNPYPTSIPTKEHTQEEKVQEKALKESTKMETSLS